MNIITVQGGLAQAYQNPEKKLRISAKIFRHYDS